MTTPVLRLTNVSKQFTLHHQGLTLPVLQNVNFEVAAGECVVLDGTSGMGKSTLLKLIYSNYRVSAGSIQYSQAGLVPLELTTASPRELIDVRRHHIGYVSQFLRVIPRISTLDLVAEPLLAELGNYEIFCVPITTSMCAVNCLRQIPLNFLSRLMGTRVSGSSH